MLMVCFGKFNCCVGEIEGVDCCWLVYFLMVFLFV